MRAAYLLRAIIIEWIVVIWIKSTYYFGLLYLQSLSCIDEIITSMCLLGKLHSNEKLVLIRKRLPLEELVMGFGPESTPARRVGSLAVVTSLLAGPKDSSNSEAFTSDDFSNSANRLDLYPSDEQSNGANTDKVHTWTVWFLHLEMKCTGTPQLRTTQ